MSSTAGEFMSSGIRSQGNSSVSLVSKADEGFLNGPLLIKNRVV